MAKHILLLMLAFSSCLFAQETRREVMHPSANPTDDTKPNSTTVPETLAMNAHLERVIVLRCKYNTDLLAELNKAVAQQKIRNAVILSGVGSVRGYQLHQVGNRDLPLKETFVRNPTGAADIIGMSGLVVGGRVHAHITLANADRAFGGHLEPETTVFTFAIVTLGVLDDTLDLSKMDDWGYR
jgi:predicted DNA-binding protein with PD1-like motif